MSLIYPMFAMVVLTMIVLGVLFSSRVRAVREGAVPAKFYRTYQGAAEPDYSAKPARHFSNLFEVPTLFYAACLAAMVTQQTGSTIQLLAWAYVVLRVLHAVVHLGANRITWRGGVYAMSWTVLIVMWIFLVAGVAMRG